MLKFTATGTGEQVREYLEGFTQTAQADELMVSFQGPSHAHAVRSMEILADAWELDPAEAAGAPGDWNEKR